MSCSLIEHFDELPDPRVRGRTDYPLIEIVFLCISAQRQSKRITRNGERFFYDRY